MQNDPSKKMRGKVIKALLRQRDDKKRRRSIMICMLACLFYMAAVCYFSNLDTPSKLIPQVFFCILMGYVAAYAISLRQFPVISEFIDWSKVEAAEKEKKKADQPEESMHMR